MRKTTQIRNNRQTMVLRKLNAAIFAIVGFCLSLPFVIDMIFTAHQAIMPLSTILFILIFIPGLPMFFFGMLGLVINRPYSSNSSNIEGDLGRIRHAVETDNQTRR